MVFIELACSPGQGGRPRGFFFSRHTPADPFTDPAKCPNCGASERDPAKNDDGSESRRGSGEAIYSVTRILGHRDVAEWKRGKALQDRALPYKAPIEQYFKISMRFIDAYSMKLRHLDLHVLLVLCRFGNHGPGGGGWTPPLSQRTIATYCMPPGRETPINRETIQDSIERLHNTQVEVWNPLTETFQTRNLVEILHSQPKRFKVNMP